MASDSSIASNRAHNPRRRSPDRVPRHRTLNGVTRAASQPDGIGLVDVDAFTTLVVRTDNSVYRIHDPQAARPRGVGPGRQVLPIADPRLLERSTFGGSCLKMGWVGLGLHMEFHAGDQWIITSHVRAIAVERSATGALC